MGGGELLVDRATSVMKAELAGNAGLQKYYAAEDVRRLCEAVVEGGRTGFAVEAHDLLELLESGGGVAALAEVERRAEKALLETGAAQVSVKSS